MISFTYSFSIIIITIIIIIISGTGVEILCKLGDNLHEIAKPIFWKKNKWKLFQNVIFKYFVLTRVLSLKLYTCISRRWIIVFWTMNRKSPESGAQYDICNVNKAVWFTGINCAHQSTRLLYTFSIDKTANLFERDSLVSLRDFPSLRFGHYPMKTTDSFSFTSDLIIDWLLDTSMTRDVFND